ncbi:hypothetical protein CAURIS_06640 [Corynebacterium auris]|nr:hypothetical protein CAURIS_06640 [Corynebacterium auris]
MTMTSPRYHGTYDVSSRALRGSAPAAVWDVPEVPVRCSAAAAVRSLGSDVRTGERSNAGPDGGEVNARLSPRETRASALMGAVFGLALLVGSALGGAFDSDGQPSGPVAATSGVLSAVGR